MIRTNRPFPLPHYVKEALDKLNKAGFVAYIVGGNVRDFLLNRETKDHDIATNATPDQLCELFPKAIQVGKAFGVLKIPIKDVAYPLEIASFRKDLDYEDSRHPRGIELASPLEDVKRRDFTINGLFYDPKTACILDGVDGAPDLIRRVIRAIGDPFERFKEDALRLLRAVRFMANFDFNLDPNTKEAIRSRSNLITQVSYERIREELNLMLTGPNPVLALKMLSELKLLNFILPELEKLKGVEQSPVYHPEGDVWVHALKVMEYTAKQNPVRSTVMAWGALLHDIGKPAAATRSGGKNFIGHEADGAKIASKICQRFKMSKHDTDLIVSFVEDHLKFKDAFQMRESTLKRFLSQEAFDDLLAIHRADSMASDGNLAFHEFCSSYYKKLEETPILSKKLISGRDLIHLGLTPGPKFSEILRSIEDLALEDKLNTKEEALEYVLKHFVE
ncbi:MAG: CCA tRNA nucleotidyltransferase [Bdellovibrio sp.]|nr:CCA tRNA nucleotidyltransferase [Bdellovibrio sp.]